MTYRLTPTQAAVETSRTLRAFRICLPIAQSAGITVPELLRKHDSPRGDPELARLQRLAYHAMSKAGLSLVFIARYAQRDRRTIQQALRPRADRSLNLSRDWTTLAAATAAMMRLAANAGIEVIDAP